jgi:hypothetical protein
MEPPEKPLDIERIVAHNRQQVRLQFIFTVGNGTPTFILSQNETSRAGRVRTIPLSIIRRLMRTWMQGEQPGANFAIFEDDDVSDDDDQADNGEESEGLVEEDGLEEAGSESGSLAGSSSGTPAQPRRRNRRGGGGGDENEDGSPDVTCPVQ